MRFSLLLLPEFEITKVFVALQVKPERHRRVQSVESDFLCRPLVHADVVPLQDDRFVAESRGCVVRVEDNHALVLHAHEVEGFFGTAANDSAI
mmetsp:Transcript_25372/g.33930  ORF Transcript_25372/g.33930 Transcript_25372/m.33930 type:complete len:93 (-) Transcript_25372:822-1100(-)